MYISSLSQGKTTINNLGYVMFNWSFLATAAWKSLGLLSPLFAHMWPLVTATTELVHSAGNLHTDNLWKFLEWSSYFVSEFKEMSYTASHLLHPPSLIVLNCRRIGPSQLIKSSTFSLFYFIQLHLYPTVTAKNSTLKKFTSDNWWSLRNGCNSLKQLFTC